MVYFILFNIELKNINKFVLIIYVILFIRYILIDY